MENEYVASILAIGSVTNKTENQDSFGMYSGDYIKALFLSDGLGSYSYSKYAKETSAAIVEYFKEKALELDSRRPVTIRPEFDEVFRDAKNRIISISEQKAITQPGNEINLFGATAVTLLDENYRIFMSYVGNGSIWHIRGNFNEFPHSTPFPWNALNYLNPHTVMQDGKEVLYRLITDSSDFEECKPTAISIGKDDTIGDIVVICSDGIFSADQQKVGKNDKGVWVRYDEKLIVLFEHLNNFFKNANYTEQNLQECINEFLSQMKDTFDDDATIGVLMTKQVLNFQHKKYWLKEDEKNNNNTV